MADEQATPVFQIQRMYLKDMSLEQPNSPAILLEQQQPSVDIQLGVGAETIADGIYEVTVTATVHAKHGDKTVFLVETKQAGIFEIRNVPQEQMDNVMRVVCPQIIYPYARSNVADVVTRAGFRRCTSRKSTSRPCTSSNRPRPPRRARAAHSSKPEK